MPDDDADKGDYKGIGWGGLQEIKKRHYNIAIASFKV